MVCLSLFLTHTHTHKSHMSMKHVLLLSSSSCGHVISLRKLQYLFFSPLNTSSSSSVSARTETTTYSHIESVPAEMCCAYLYNIKRDSNCSTSTANVSLQRRPRGRAGCEFSDGRDFSFGGRVEHTNKSVVHVSISETDHRHDFFD